MKLALLALLLTACTGWNAPLRTRVGDERWHACGAGLYCRQYERCQWPLPDRRPSCEFVGDVDGPGPGDTDQSGSSEAQPQQ